MRSYGKDAGVRACVHVHWLPPREGRGPLSTVFRLWQNGAGHVIAMKARQGCSMWERSTSTQMMLCSVQDSMAAKRLSQLASQCFSTELVVLSVWLSYIELSYKPLCTARQTCDAGRPQALYPVRANQTLLASASRV